MTRALMNQVARIERALGAADDDRAGQMWVPPERALQHQELLLGLLAGIYSTPEGLAEARARAEAALPCAGYWTKPLSPSAEEQLVSILADRTARLARLLADPTAADFAPADYGFQPVDFGKLMVEGD
jgi:hypothetical protein